jgi:hypothetical protein
LWPTKPSDLVRPLTLFLFFNLLPFCHYGQDTSYLAKPPLVIARASGPVVLDGLSHEPVWQQATSLPFIVFELLTKLITFSISEGFI